MGLVASTEMGDNDDNQGERLLETGNRDFSFFLCRGLCDSFYFVLLPAEWAPIAPPEVSFVFCLFLSVRDIISIERSDLTAIDTFFFCGSESAFQYLHRFCYHRSDTWSFHPLANLSFKPFAPLVQVPASSQNIPAAPSLPFKQQMHQLSYPATRSKTKLCSSKHLVL